MLLRANNYKGDESLDKEIIKTWKGWEIYQLLSNWDDDNIELFMITILWY